MTICDICYLRNDRKLSGLEAHSLAVAKLQLTGSSTGLKDSDLEWPSIHVCQAHKDAIVQPFEACL